MNPHDAVEEFHKAANVPVGGSFPDPTRRRLRRRLIFEELSEYLEAEAANDQVEVLDSLVDLVYVIVGPAVEYGMNFSAAFKAVHTANMAKAGSDGKFNVRDDGKVHKPDGWRPADLRPFIE